MGNVDCDNDQAFPDPTTLNQTAQGCRRRTLGRRKLPDRAKSGFSQMDRSTSFIQLVVVRPDVLLDVLGDLLVGEGIGVGAGGGLELALDVDDGLALDGLARRGEALQDGLPLADLVGDLGLVGGGVVGGLGAIALSAAAAHAVAVALSDVPIFMPRLFRSSPSWFIPSADIPFLASWRSAMAPSRACISSSCLAISWSCCCDMPIASAAFFMSPFCIASWAWLDLVGELLELLEALGLLLELLHLALDIAAGSGRRSCGPPPTASSAARCWPGR